MKEQLRLLMLTLLCAVFNSVGAVDVTDVLTRDLTGVTGNSYTAWSGIKVTSNAVYAGQSAGGNDAIQLRSTADKSGNFSGIITTSSGGTVKSVTVTWNSNTASGRTLNVYGSDTPYTGPNDLFNDDSSGTLLGTIVFGTSTTLEIEGEYAFIGLRSNSGAMYLTNVTIVWNAESAPTPTPPTKPTFTPEAGTYTSAQTVTISCATEGASIYYTTNGSDPTSSSVFYEGPITIAETTTLKAIAIKGNGNSAIATAEYIIDQPTSISAARQQAEGSVFTTGTVTSVNGSTAYIQDASAAICVYGASGLAVGDNITVSGELSTYNGLLEITKPSCKVISQGNTISPTTKTIAEINADYAASNALQGWLVRIEEATVNEISGQNTTISQGENTIVVRGISGVTLKVGDIVSLTGNIGCFNAAQIANPTDIAVTANETPSITATPTSIEVNNAETEGTITVTYDKIENYGVQFFEQDGTTQKDAAPDWISYEFDTDGNLNYTIAQNGGEERKAYLKVYGSGATTQENYFSELITVTQAAAPAALAIPWEEDFSAENALSKYTITNGGTTSKIYKEKLAGGESPELLISKSGGSMSATFDLNGYSGDLTLSFLSNNYNNLTITCDESEVTASSTPGTYYLSIEEGTTKFTLTFENKASSNARVDNFKLVKGKTSVKEPAGLAYSAKTFTATIGQENAFPVLSNENGLDVTYASSDEAVATISAEGVITLVAAGTTVISASSEENEEFQAGNASYTLTVEQAEEEQIDNSDKFELVEDITTLAAGDKIIFVGDVTSKEDGLTKYYGLGTNQKTNNRAAVSVTYTGGIITGNNKLQTITLEGDENGWYFNVGDGYLYAAGSSKNNYLRTEPTIDESNNAKAIISVENEKTSIVFQGTNTNNTLLFNSSSDLFSCYAEGSTAGKAVHIYRFTENPKAAAGLAYSAETFTATIGQENAFPVLSNENGLNVTYASSDETVATIDEEGNITLVAAGTTTISASSEENEEYKAGYTSYVLTVVQPEEEQKDNSDVFELVTDFSTLAADDEIIFVGENSVTDEEENTTTYYYGLSTNQNPNNRQAVTVTHNTNGTITGNNKLQTITLEGDETGWYFNVGNGYLYAAGSNKNNYLRTEPTIDENNNAKAIISAENEKTSIVFQGTNTNNTLQFNAGNAANLLFSCYAKASQKEVKIYRKVDSTTILIGDANGDGYVTVADVMLTVEYVFNSNVEGFHFENADINSDGKIGVTDVMGIVDIVLK